uniref:Ribosomal protein L34 n=1 Tax=Cryptomonas curvata TaxID=233186 RepID=A0A222AH88_9CRYP|nr:ribosomal protein L34 [Cryptomonas curvata]ASO75735.1 ribosomal protein L34 [Cryptomonas curvata]
MTKRTLHGTKLKRARTSGFRARIKTTSGRRILKNRRARGRHSISIK